MCHTDVIWIRLHELLREAGYQPRDVGLSADWVYHTVQVSGNLFVFDNEDTNELELVTRAEVHTEDGEYVDERLHASADPYAIVQFLQEYTGKERPTESCSSLA